MKVTKCDDLPAAPAGVRRWTASNSIGCVTAVTEPRQPDESLIALAEIQVTEQSLEKTLRQVLELTCAALPGGDEGGITLLEAGGPDTTIATSDSARRVDRSQYDAESGGPCLDAYRRQEILRIDSTASDERWPEFAGTAAAEGLRSTLSIPLVVGGDGLGALNVYCHREHGFAVADERLATTLGSCASVALSNARTYWRAARLADQLQQALSMRGIIDQATGIIIAQHACSADHALHLLNVAAQRNRLTLAEVGSDLVDRTSNQQRPA
jgi:GAF domain-containing protein